jgi:hypothetical protein
VWQTVAVETVPHAEAAVGPYVAVSGIVFAQPAENQVPLVGPEHALVVGHDQMLALVLVLELGLGLVRELALVLELVLEPVIGPVLELGLRLVPVLVLARELVLVVAELKVTKALVS